MNFLTNIKNQLKNLYPGYFALVMATGIIDIACIQLHLEQVARFLFLLNNALYLVLALLLAGRLVWFLPEVRKDIASHKKGAGFLTFVAASCVLGSEYVKEHQMFTPGILLFFLALVAWVFVIYTFLSISILRNEKPSPETGLNGSWLLIVVSTQSLVILALALSSRLTIASEVTFFITLTAWLVGILLYVILLTLIFYRLAFYPVTPSEITPDFWIDTGAAAISALAGATFINAGNGMPMVQQYLPVIKLLSLLLWGAASFWLPLLCIIEKWRHLKSGFKYRPGYWSLVFPLGMYAVASFKLGNALQITLLIRLAQQFVYIALAAWLIIFGAMVYRILRSFLSSLITF